MNVSKSISSLIWKFKKSFLNDDGSTRKNIKPFYPNEKDLENLNIIAGWVDSQKEENINQNRIFAKLFIELMITEIWKTSSYDFALDKIRMILEPSLESKYKQFQIEMMMFNFDQACEMLGEPNELDYSKGVSVDERREYTKKRLKFIKSNETDLKKALISDHWNEENTNTRLNDLISDLITMYRNNK